MKNHIFLFFLAFSVFITSCKKDDGPSTKAVKLSIHLKADESIGFDLPLKGSKVVITNNTNGQEYESLADANGDLAFESILPGSYSLVASLTIEAEDYSAISGVSTTDDVHLNANKSNLDLFEDQQIELNMLPSGRVGNFVFKQIYYAGSNTSKGAMFRDVFLEIYNNSNETLHADSLYFSQLTGAGTIKDDRWYLSDGTYDWSKSLNINDSKNANTHYVYAKSIFMIPSDASGKKYPVEPGKSLIVAATALNHKQPYQNASGEKTIEVIDPTLTIDLSKADFEVYLYPYLLSITPGTSPFASDIDTPAPNVDVLFSTGQKDLLLDPLGREAFVLFKKNGEVDPKDFSRFSTPDVRETTSNTVLYPQIPVSYILDGVQTQNPLVSSRVARRVPSSIDAGAAQVDGGQYSGQSIVRKTKQLVNGRRILQDTNNSSNDFGVLNQADPTKGESSFID